MQKRTRAKNKSRFIWLFAICLALASLAIWDSCQTSSTTILLSESSTEEQAQPKSSAVAAETEATYPIYLVGAVNTPGIYLITPGAYLYEVIELAGGLTADAAADAVNLAASLENNQLVRIPTKAEIEQGYQADGWSKQSEDSGLVDLNRADQAQLETLPGIGPATARAIISYREANGGFATIEDLMQVPGIKQARFAALKDLIMVSSP